ncbi:CAP domain-containing protein [Sandarakinorhabdus sp. DWP1-3-1]|uniref:CAP domain-containing protein n=1 Tax=Sandarakinorhabdus sp. DWP1-3-1 TaxID=2804627 RepID=UPI003CEE1845
MRMLAVAVMAMLAGSPAASLTLDAAVLDEINYARTQPQAYAQVLRDYRRSFRGLVVDDPADPGYRTTVEGVRAVDEAIRFVERQPPLSPLAEAEVLTLAAVDHVAAQSRRGEVGHISADGGSPSDRVARRGGGVYVAETIAYGSNNPIAVVRQLIIDDGVANRGHRAVIFDPRFRHAGVGCGPHPVYGSMCVVDFAATRDGRPAPR